jgi:hypothetical protein
LSSKIAYAYFFLTVTTFLGFNIPLGMHWFVDLDTIESKFSFFIFRWATCDTGHFLVCCSAVHCTLNEYCAILPTYDTIL